ncbi:hypothetical protein AB1K91_05115 [Terribacillus sp. 179-K 1B1 HS]|uniref:hypothetical protein n=1 Tax=Terribacillus sp. 179-K 1B1 HS TaxID=3142388 RepID=UPI0039A285D8
MGKQIYLTDLQLKLITRLLDNCVDGADHPEEEQKAFGDLSHKVHKAIESTKNKKTTHKVAVDQL